MLSNGKYIQIKINMKTKFEDFNEKRIGVSYAMNSNGMKNKNVTFTKSEAKSINTILDEYGRNDIEYVFKRIDGTIILICFNGDVENKTIFKNEKEFLEQIVQDELTTNYKDFYNVIYDDVEDYDIAANYKDFIFIGCADL